MVEPEINPNGVYVKRRITLNVIVLWARVIVVTISGVLTTRYALTALGIDAFGVYVTTVALPLALSFLTGAMWPLARIHYYGAAALCPHCGVLQSLMHQLRECPHTCSIDHAHIIETNKLAPQAVADNTRQCFWTRGLLPNDLISLLPVDHPLSHYNPVFYTHAHYRILVKDRWPSGIYFGDGSGGKFTSHPALRRCGVGICLVVDEQPVAAAWTPLPGEIQTVGRAELYALLQVVTNASPLAVITFFTDCLNIRDTYLAGPAKSNNADWWHICWEQMYAKQLMVRIVWLPSHVSNNPKNKPIPSYVLPWHIKANDLVDKLASHAASEVQLPATCFTKYFKYIKLLKPIQYRATSIFRHLEPRKKHRCETPLRFPVATLLFATDHILFEEEDSVKKVGIMCCQTCHGRVNINSPIARQFLTSPCVPLDKSEFGLVIPIGNKFTHPSHKLKLYGGVYICLACGYVSRKRVFKLADPCTQPNKAGARNLRYYTKGKAPVGCLGWPYKVQHQRSFAFTKPPGKISKEDTITVARVLEQVNIMVLSERITKISNDIAVSDSDTEPEELITSIDPATSVGRPLLHNTLDDPEGGCPESDDERMFEVAPITEPPDDWLYDYGISSESD